MPTSTNDQQEVQDLYAVLSLPYTSPPSEKAIRNAYRRALLLHHPDKSKSASGQSAPSIDHITTAYKTLIDPLRRKEYDRSRTIIALTSAGPPTIRAPGPGAPEQYPGLETVDLGEMNFVAGDLDGDGIYWRGCRCGKEAMAYEVPEKELEAYLAQGEIVIGCHGCSLWLRVFFASVEEEEDGEGGG